MSTTYEQHRAELVAQLRTFFVSRGEAQAALNRAGIRARDYCLFYDVVPGGYDVRLEQAAGHILNLNHPLNTASIPGVHLTGDSTQSQRRAIRRERSLKEAADNEPIRVAGAAAGRACMGLSACPYALGDDATRVKRFYWIQGWSGAYERAMKKRVPTND
jgi:hypothetical protein